MIFLLDADTLITADRLAYPLSRFPVFWDWLAHQGITGIVKVPIEQYEEVTVGKGELVDWLKTPDIMAALLFPEDSDPEIVTRVTLKGYGALDEDELEQVGRDPFLIAHALRDPKNRTVVTFENSAPSKKRANRKIPDVCTSLDIRSCTLFNMIRELDFTTDWQSKQKT